MLLIFSISYFDIFFLYPFLLMLFSTPFLLEFLLELGSQYIYSWMSTMELAIVCSMETFNFRLQFSRNTWCSIVDVRTSSEWLCLPGISIAERLSEPDYMLAVHLFFEHLHLFILSLSNKIVFIRIKYN